MPKYGFNEFDQWYSKFKNEENLAFVMSSILSLSGSSYWAQPFEELPNGDIKFIAEDKVLSSQTKDVYRAIFDFSHWALSWAGPNRHYWHCFAEAVLSDPESLD